MEAITDHRRSDRGVEYLVQWEGYSTPTWEPAEHILGVELLQDYWRRRTTQSGPPETADHHQRESPAGDVPTEEQPDEMELAAQFTAGQVEVKEAVGQVEGAGAAPSESAEAAVSLM